MIVNEIAMHAPKGIFNKEISLLLVMEYMTNNIPMSEAKNKHTIPLIGPSHAPIKPDNRMSPNPSTSFLFFIKLISRAGILKYNIDINAPKPTSIIDSLYIRVLNIISIYKIIIT